MTKSGWYLLVPAAFFFTLNVCLADSLSFAVITGAHFALLVLLFLFFRTVDLNRVLPLIVATVSGLLFTYGILQKTLFFPRYLDLIREGNDELSRTIAIRIQSGRVFTIFTLPTLYAIVCAVLIVFTLHFLIRNKGMARLGWIFLLLAGIINLLLTQSFGGVIYLAAGTLAYLFFSGILTARVLAPTLMALFLFLFAITGLRFSEAQRLDPARLRLSNWQQAARLVAQNPLFGIGLGNYAADVSTVTRKNEARSIFAHNALLQEVAETGLLFNLFLVMLLWRYRHRIRPPSVRLSSHHLAVLVMLAIYNLIDIGTYFFAAGFLLVIALSQVYRRHSPPAARWLIPALPLALILVITSASGDALQDGRILLSRQQLSEATDAFATSLKWNPWNAAAHLGMAQVHLLNKHLDAAADAANRALEIQPGAPYGHFLLSRVRLDQERFQDALYHAERAVQRRPAHAPYARWRQSMQTIFNHEKTAGSN
ncbi:MAG: tetratricopeptide repeat protein [Candidatus Aminicenantes bacterium]|nr:tetratricopeptide repeat protein [Candidatus Aminicenantes bacterium]